MIMFNAILVGLKEVWAHKFRSLLTMMGIILGVASLVGMGALVKGMENGLKESMLNIGGADKLWLEEEEVPTWQEHLADQAPGRTIRDVEALRASAPLLRLVSPEMAVERARISRGSEATYPSECVGVWRAVLDMNLHQVAYGRFFTQMDEARAANVCVIGTGIRDELFGPTDESGNEIIPLGETIFIKGQPFTIVGLLAHYETEAERREREMNRNQKARDAAGPARRKGWRRHGGALWYKNNVVFMPLNTAWVRFRAASGSTNNIPDPRLTAVDIKVRDLQDLPAALQQARNVLLITHRGIEDFEFRTQENQIEAVSKQITNTRISGGVIAGIALIVGGIGIMNIMFASIQERIREIGICKAIGANGPAVFTQVLMESLTISLVGAGMGIVASFGMVRILNQVSPTQNEPVIELSLLIFAVACSALVGLIAGLFPAVKAAQLNPIQALRFE